MGMFNWIGEIFTSMVGDMFSTSIMKTVGKVASKAAGTIGKAAAPGAKQFVDDKVIRHTKAASLRSAVLHYIASLRMPGLSALASENLLRHLQERADLAPRPYDKTRRYKYGDENELYMRLCEMYEATEGNDRFREQLFIWLGELDDPKFDEMIEALTHDPVEQWIKRIWAEVETYFAGLNKWAEKNDPKIASWITGELRKSFPTDVERAADRQSIHRKPRRLGRFT